MPKSKLVQKAIVVDEKGRVRGKVRGAVYQDHKHNVLVVLARGGRINNQRLQTMEHILFITIIVLIIHHNCKKEVWGEHEAAHTDLPLFLHPPTGPP